MRASVTAMTVMLMMGSAAFAEPPKNAPVKRPEPTQPANPPAQIVLASADAIRAPATDGSPASQSPKRHVAPRVTTCRCGDPQVADPENQDQ